ncbi:MAG TPA: hypothetical protein VMS16_13085 [Mycobacterium sp.]|nr:hypothetical protein [Mycobacterium sp.]
MQDDLDLWRNIVREYSEELLGEPEHDGGSGQPLDYECWSFYCAMQRAVKLDTCGPMFWVDGRIIASLGDDQSAYRLPFTEATVRQFLDREPLGGTSGACLALAWRYRGSLV